MQHRFQSQSVLMLAASLALAAVGCKGSDDGTPSGAAGSGTAGTQAGASAGGAGSSGAGAVAGEGAGPTAGTGAAGEQAGSGAAGNTAGTGASGSGGGEVVCKGPITVTTEAELAAIAGCTQITPFGLSIDGSQLTSVSLPLLNSVQGLAILNNTLLTSVSFPALVDAFGVTLQHNAVLTVVDLPLLTDLPSGIDAQENAALEEISASGLLTAGGNGVFIKLNPKLTLLDVNALENVNGNFFVYQNDVLSEARAAALTTVVAGFAITDNPKLPACSAQAIFDQLVDYTGGDSWPQIFGNDDAAVCP